MKRGPGVGAVRGGTVPVMHADGEPAPLASAAKQSLPPVEPSTAATAVRRSELVTALANPPPAGAAVLFPNTDDAVADEEGADEEGAATRPRATRFGSEPITDANAGSIPTGSVPVAGEPTSGADPGAVGAPGSGTVTTGGTIPVIGSGRIGTGSGGGSVGNGGNGSGSATGNT